MLLGDRGAQAARLPGEARWGRPHPDAPCEGIARAAAPQKRALPPRSQVLNQDLCLLLTNQLQLRGGCAECEMRWERSADKCDG